MKTWFVVQMSLFLTLDIFYIQHIYLFIYFLHQRTLRRRFFSTDHRCDSPLHSPLTQICAQTSGKRPDPPPSCPPAPLPLLSLSPSCVSFNWKQVWRNNNLTGDADRSLLGHLVYHLLLAKWHQIVEGIFGDARSVGGRVGGGGGGGRGV